MKTLLYLLFFLFFIVSCNNAKNDIESVSKDANNTIDSILDSQFNTGNNLIIDSSRIDSFYNQFDYKKWYKLSDYFSVYRYKDSFIGIGIDLMISHTTKVDAFEVLNNYFSYKGYYQNENNNYIDSFSSFRIEEFPRKSIFSSDSITLFIICTKGVTKSIVENYLLANADGCGLQLIIKLSNIDFNQFGEPLIATYIKPNLQYINEKDIASILKTNHYNNIQSLDYYDSFIPIQFARNGNYIYTYSDDFNWRINNNELGINFPSRHVYELKNGKLKVVWSSEIDLFGVPCD